MFLYMVFHGYTPYSKMVAVIFSLAAFMLLVSDSLATILCLTGLLFFEDFLFSCSSNKIKTALPFLKDSTAVSFKVLFMVITQFKVS